MRMDLVPYNNQSILTDVPPVLKKNFEELFYNGVLGFSTLTLNDVSAISHFTEDDFKYSYSYIIRVPYAGNRLVWEVSFDPEDFKMAPDFYFNDDNFTLSNDIDNVVENIPSLLNWDVENPKSLTVVLKEFLNLYKKQQILKLEQDNIYAQLNLEYQDLTEAVTPQDIEVSLEDSGAHFLINITLDTSSLPEYLQTQDEKILNPGADTCVLKVSFLKLDAIRVKTSLQLSPRLDQIFGYSHNLVIPSYTKANSLVEYVNLVIKLLENHVKKVEQRHTLRKEFMTSMCAMYPEKVVEFDAETFSNGVLFMEVDNFECLVEIELGELFPDEQPTVTLFSLYCLPLKKVCSEQVDGYLYSPRWPPEEMLEKLMSTVTTITRKFINHKH